MQTKTLLRSLALCAALTPFVTGSSCTQANAFKTTHPDLGSGVEIGPFPKPPKGAMGYHLYMSEKADGKFERVSDAPVMGGGKVVIPYLKAGKLYYFRMTTVATDDAFKESAPSAVFNRKAILRK